MQEDPEPVASESTPTTVESNPNKGSIGRYLFNDKNKELINKERMKQNLLLRVTNTLNKLNGWGIEIQQHGDLSDADKTEALKWLDLKKKSITDVKLQFEKLSDEDKKIYLDTYNNILDRKLVGLDDFKNDWLNDVQKNS